VAKAGISVELILQNASVNKVTDISFTVRQADAAATRRILDSLKSAIGARSAGALERLAKVQIVGTGILNDPAYVGQMFKALGHAKVNILAIGTSEVRITCLVHEEDQAKAKAALNEAFQVGVAG
jgi:aspartate kinase